VNVTWQCYQQLRSVYHAIPAKGREIAIKVLDSFHTCPIPEVARLGRTLRAWRAQVLAYFDTHGVSNGATEAINLIIEKVCRLAHGFKDFDHYRLRIMLAADGRRPYRAHPTMPKSEDPVKGTDLSRWSAEDLQAVAVTLNGRPPKTLGWKTPAEALDEL
jgi:Transposase